MVNYVRGQQSMESAGIYRDREHLLGDIASAKPAYVRNPRRSYGDAGYGPYKAAQESRQAMVYVAANDGMLHALNATTGEETWAYVPRMLLPELYRLSDANYANIHRYYVDGSPEAGDVYFSSDSAWHTILVGGLNKGGKGYYALDITNPTDPVVLWEICSDAALCKISDSDIGYSYGNPIITKRPSDGKWVVLFTSGYNNVSPGTGRGFLYVVDAATGAILEKIDTGAGSTANPSGLAKITGRAMNASTDNTATLVYGGDLLGNLWRFDMATYTVTKLAVLTDEDGATQPITSRPDVGLCGNNSMVYVGTGKYLGTSDLTPPNPPSPDYQTQSMYGIKDNGTAWGTFRGTNAEQQVFQALSGGGWTLTDEKRDFLTSASGWYVDFTINNGERVNLDPALVLGTLVVVTNQPEDVSACSVGGNSYKYEFEYCSGSWLKASPNNQVGKKIGSSIAVGFIVIRLPSGALKVISTFAGSEKSTEGVTGSGTGKVRRISWREVTE
jgi:type IV pilus assembly protein PilY1